MIRLYGIPVDDHHARALVATLINDNQRHSRQAAATISRGLDRGAALVALTPEERLAIFAALEDPPENGGLAELRGAIARDLDHRLE